MAQLSNIEWTDRTANPIRARRKSTGKVGWHCIHASEGCRNCYAETLNLNTFFGNGLPYKPTVANDIEVFLDDKVLNQILRMRKPCKIFMSSMTDLFGDWVTDDMLDRIYAVMALCPHITFQIVTKRTRRMRDYLRSRNGMGNTQLCRAINEIPAKLGNRHGALRMPLPNVWHITSIEDQKTANERVPLLLGTPSAVRGISAEPLLGDVNLRQIIRETEHRAYVDNSLTGFVSNGCGGTFGPRLDWVICGGESGPKARPMHPEWARSLRDQCANAGVAFFFKQWGEWLPGEANVGQFDETPMHAYRRCDNHSYQWPKHHGGSAVQNFGTHPDRFSGALTTQRVGKAKAGRLLDGREHNDFPKVLA